MKYKTVHWELILAIPILIYFYLIIGLGLFFKKQEPPSPAISPLSVRHYEEFKRLNIKGTDEFQPAIIDALCLLEKRVYELENTR